MEKQLKNLRDVVGQARKDKRDGCRILANYTEAYSGERE